MYGLYNSVACWAKPKSTLPLSGQPSSFWGNIFFCICYSDVASLHVRFVGLLKYSCFRSKAAQNTDHGMGSQWRGQTASKYVRLHDLFIVHAPRTRRGPSCMVLQ